MRPKLLVPFFFFFSSKLRLRPFGNLHPLLSVIWEGIERGDTNCQVDTSVSRRSQEAERGVVTINTEMEKGVQLFHLNIRLQMLNLFVDWT